MYVKPIAGDPAIRQRVMANLSLKKEILKAFTTALEERPIKDVIHEPYLCLGCQVAGGTVRKSIIGMVSYPLQRVVLEDITGYRFTMQAYHAQSYEDTADPGPGAVFGLRRANSKRLGSRGTSASVALKMGLWVNSATNFPYEDEDIAKVKLWQLAEERYAPGLSFLSGMTIEPDEPQHYPLYVAHCLHALLGVEALRQLVAEQLGLNLVLIDADRLIGEKHLRWEHYSPWAV